MFTFSSIPSPIAWHLCMVPTTILCTSTNSSRLPRDSDKIPPLSVRDSEVCYVSLEREFKELTSRPASTRWDVHLSPPPAWKGPQLRLPKAWVWQQPDIYKHVSNILTDGIKPVCLRHIIALGLSTGPWLNPFAFCYYSQPSGKAF